MIFEIERSKLCQVVKIRLLPGSRLLTVEFLLPGMPITDSAKKAIRQSERRRARNLRRNRTLKQVLKEFKKTPGKETYARLQKALDKAAKTGVIHRNRAARTKARLSRLLKK